MLGNILNQIKELKEIEESTTIKLTDNKFLFVEIYAPVTDEEKFVALELNSGYEDNEGYVLEDVIDSSVIDYGDWKNVSKAIEYFITA